jgi:hypothetical protein
MVAHIFCFLFLVLILWVGGGYFVATNVVNLRKRNVGQED